MASEMAQSVKSWLALQAWGLSLLPRTNGKGKRECVAQPCDTSCVRHREGYANRQIPGDL